MKGVVVVMILLLACFVVMDWWMLSRIQESSHGLKFKYKVLRANSSTLFIREELEKLGKVKKPQKTIYARLLAKAAHALAEGQNKPEPRDLWQEPFILASSWRPCADQRNWEPSEGNNGYILVSANGGINQQRVAVCNVVAVARLLNATLVVPHLLYSSVWRDVRYSICWNKSGLHEVILGTIGRKQGTSAKGAICPSTESSLCKKEPKNTVQLQRFLKEVRLLTLGL